MSEGLISVLAAGVLGVGVPVIAVRMLMPVLVGSRETRSVNFRGAEVHYGLGLVWLVWSGSALALGMSGHYLGMDAAALDVLMATGGIALVAFTLGIVDDAYGSTDARGFKGHLGALAAGRLTTGGMKLIGIGMASLAAAFAVSGSSAWGLPVYADSLGAARMLVGVAIAGAAIALTSNFVNLTDLRPGRALKVYALLGMLGVVSAASLLGAFGVGVEPSLRAHLATRAAVLGLLVVGPVVAAWPYDLGERAMLGDAGANPMGAVAGTLVVVGLPLWGLIVYALLMLALNLASEKVSFSAVIESNAALNWLDSLGRMPESALSSQFSESDTHPKDTCE